MTKSDISVSIVEVPDKITVNMKFPIRFRVNPMPMTYMAEALLTMQKSSAFLCGTTMCSDTMLTVSNLPSQPYNEGDEIDSRIMQTSITSYGGPGDPFTKLTEIEAIKSRIVKYCSCDSCQKWRTELKNFQNSDNSQASTKYLNWKSGIRTIILGLLYAELRTVRGKIFDSAFPSIVPFLSATTNAVLLGGRVTNSVAPSQSIRNPEFAEYLIKSKKGVVSASHMHLNCNHQTEDGNFSCYQYWLWTYQAEGAPPRVASTSGRYCGVFSGDGNPTEIRNKFLTHCAKEGQVKKNHKKFEPRIFTDDEELSASGEV